MRKSKREYLLIDIKYPYCSVQFEHLIVLGPHCHEDELCDTWNQRAHMICIFQMADLCLMCGHYKNKQHGSTLGRLSKYLNKYNAPFPVTGSRCELALCQETHGDISFTGWLYYILHMITVCVEVLEGLR